MCDGTRVEIEKDEVRENNNTQTEVEINMTEKENIKRWSVEMGDEVSDIVDE